LTAAAAVELGEADRIRRSGVDPVDHPPGRVNRNPLRSVEGSAADVQCPGPAPVEVDEEDLTVSFIFGPDEEPIRDGVVSHSFGGFEAGTSGVQRAAATAIDACKPDRFGCRFVVVPINGFGGHGAAREKQQRNGSKCNQRKAHGNLPVVSALRDEMHELSLCRLVLQNRNRAALAGRFELHDAFAGGEDRVVAAEADAVAGPKAGAALADDDLAAADALAGEDLDAEHVRVGFAAVAAGAETFLVRHA